MPFGVVSEVGREMSVLDGGGDCRRGGAVFLGGRPIVTNGDGARPPPPKGRYWASRSGGASGGEDAKDSCGSVYVSALD